MKDADKTKAQLISELEDLRQRVINLEKAEVDLLSMDDLTRTQLDLALALSAAQSLDESLRRCVEAAIRVSGMDCGGVYLVDENTGSIDLAFHTGLPRAFVERALHYEADSPQAQLIQAGKPIYSQHQVLGLPLDDVRRSEDLRAIAVIPVYHESRVIACLNIASHTLDEVHVSARTMLETIAAQIGSSIVRIRAQAELLKAHDDLEQQVEERNVELVQANEQLRQQINRHKRAKEALRESEEKYRILVEQANDGILIVQNGMIKFANRRLAEANGRTVEELLDTNFLDYVHPDEVPKVANRYQRRLAGEDVEQIYETVLLHKDGHEIPVEINAGGITYQGNPAVFAFVRDHTERKRAEEALHKAHKELERRVEERTEEVLQANERLKREIAERKQAEEALRESEKRYKLATVAGQVGVWDWDIETSDIYLDPNLKAMLGFEDHEIRNHLDDWGRYVHPDDAELVMSEAEAHLKGLTRQYEVAHRMLHKDGSVRWFLARGTALKDAGGKPYRVLGTDTDITERKRAEEELQRAHQELQTLVEKRTAELVEINEQLRQQITEHKRAEEELRESEERFRKAFDYAALGMVLVSPGGRFLKVNSYFCQMVGYTEGELLNRTFNDVTHPDDYHISLDVLSQVVDGIEPYAWAEKRYLHKDGRIVWGMLSTAAIRDAVDNVVYLVSHIQDITERKLAEEALRESEERYSSLFKNNHSVMLLINPENAAIVDANPAACSFYGWSHEELTSRKITDINTLTREQVCREMKRAQSGKAQHFLFRHRLANDEIRDVEVYSGPITIEGKQLLYSIIHDISERRLAEEQLQQAHIRLEQRAVELSQLNEKLKQEIEERKLVEQKLRVREAELKTKANELEEVNVALRVLLKRRDEDKTELGEKILSNVKELVLPYVERLRKAKLTSQCAAYVNILESNLNDIISPFALKLSSKLLGLTPTEIQVANLIKEGKTTKDIAVMFHLSPRTVEFHRNNIRKKMGIKNKKANLRSHLQSM